MGAYKIFFIVLARLNILILVWYHNGTNMFLSGKNKKLVQIVWAVVCVLIIISMVLLYIPSLFR